MSKQELEVIGQEADGACCQGLAKLASAPLAEDQAVELAKVFKALGDPARLRLLSMIASREGGEVCVCELTPARRDRTAHPRLARRPGCLIRSSHRAMRPVSPDGHGYSHRPDRQEAPAADGQDAATSGHAH
jgi:hypothetical protein